MKWTRRILLGLIVLAGLVTALWWEENWRGQKIWEESCARLRAAGEPVDIADIIPPMIPDEENVAAAPIFAEIFTSEKAARILRDPFVPLRPINRKAKHQRFPPSDLDFAHAGDESVLLKWRDFLATCFRSESQIQEDAPPAQQILTMLSEFDEEWREVGQAVRRPECRWPVEYVPSPVRKEPHLGAYLRVFARARPRLVVQAFLGHTEAYHQDLLTLMMMARHLAKSPTSKFSYSVANSCYGLAFLLWRKTSWLVQLEDDDLLILQTEASNVSLLDLRNALQLDRVLTTTHLLDTGDSRLIIEPPVPPLEWTGLSKYNRLGLHSLAIHHRPKGWALAEMASLQDFLHSEIQGLVPPSCETLAPSAWNSTMLKIEDMRTRARDWTLEPAIATLAKHSLGDLDRLVGNVALARCATAWCAAMRYELKHGKPPERLDALCPEFLSEVPKDPIDGAPLRYRAKAQHYLIYSIAWDGVDNGGSAIGDRMEPDWVWPSSPGALEHMK